MRRNLVVPFVLVGVFLAAVLMPAAEAAPQPTIQITKVADASVVSAGDQIGYTITVTNPSKNKTTVDIMDQLPTNTGLSWTVAPLSPNCSTSSGGHLCSSVKLDSSASFSVHIVSPTTRATCGTVSNTAHVGSNNLGSAASQTATITVNCPQLQVAKTADASTVAAGHQAGYTITGSNTGAGNAYGFTLNDPLPSGLTWSLDTQNSNGSCSISAGATQTLSCAPGTLGPSGTVSAHVTATTSASNCPGISNTASVAATNAVSKSTNAIPITIACALPDLVVQSIAFTSGSPYTDSPWYYTATIKNQGAGTADLSGIGVQGYFAATSGTWPGDAAACGDSFPAGTMLAPGATADIAIGCGAHPAADDNWLVVKVNYEPPPYGIAESDLTNNIASVPLPVTLSVTKVADNASVSAGSPVGYSLTGTNNGPVTAYGFALTDTLPAGYTWALTSGSDSSCAITSTAGMQTLTCNPATVVSGGSVSAHVTASTTGASCGTISNTANVSATSATTVTSAPATITVMCLPDLVISQMTIDHPANYPTASYTVTVTNQGSGTANLGGVGVQGYYGTSPTDWPTNDPACGTSFSPGTMLASGASVDIVVGCSAFIPSADDYLVAKVDSSDIVAETNEGNNLGSIYMPTQ